MKTFRDYFPIRKPPMFRSLDSTYFDPYLTSRKKTLLDSLGGTILGAHCKEIRGKYSRPVETINGLVKFKTETDPVTGKKTSLKPARKSIGTTKETRKTPMIIDFNDEIVTDKGGIAGIKVKSVGNSPRKVPKDYIRELESLVTAEKKVFP